MADIKTGLILLIFWWLFFWQFWGISVQDHSSYCKKWTSWNTRTHNFFTERQSCYKMPKLLPNLAHTLQLFKQTGIRMWVCCSWAKEKFPRHAHREEIPATKQMERLRLPHLANRTLSLSSLPHSQPFPGSTAKCKGSSLCSESVSGITAEKENETQSQADSLRKEGIQTQVTSLKPHRPLTVVTSQSLQVNYTQH